MNYRRNKTINQSLLILNDDCIMHIFQHLTVVDYVNLAKTCIRLRVVARDFSSRKHKKIEIDPVRKASDKIISLKEFSKMLSVIGEHILEVEIHSDSILIHESVKEKCKNLKSISAYGYPSLLEGFRNLKQLKVTNSSTSISENEWEHFFASNPELEVLHYTSDYGDGFIKSLTHLPKLKDLRLQVTISSVHPDLHHLQHLRQLTALTKLSLFSFNNLNGILIDLAKSLDLVELSIRMEFDSESLRILKSFKKLEVLSIYSSFSNANIFSQKLQHSKMENIDIPCRKLILHTSNYHCKLNGILIDLVRSMNLVELDISMAFDCESLAIIKSFKELEVLSIDACGYWQASWHSDATIFSPKLQRLKIQDIDISCSEFLKIVEHLTFLKEFDLGKFGEIHWDNKNIKFMDSQPLIIEAIENALIPKRRKLKIHRYVYRKDSAVLYQSDHLQIINSYSVEKHMRSRRISVKSELRWF